MLSIPKIIGVMSCGFVLYLGLSNATQAGNAGFATDDMQAGKGAKKGEQAGQKTDQDKLKRNDMKAGHSAGESGQAGVKGEKDKMKGVEINAGESTDKRNEKGQDEMGDQPKGAH